MGFEGPATPTTGIWDLNEDWPTGTDFRSKGDDHFRFFKAAVQQSFPGLTEAVLATAEELDQVVGVTDPIQGQLDAITTRLDAIETDITDDVKSNLYAPVGTRMVVHQAAAPAGWTNAADYNDRVLMAVSAGAGGGSGSWIISGISAANHTLTINQIPTHNHGGGDHGHNLKAANDAQAGGNDDSLTGAATVVGGYIWNSGPIIQSQGGNQSHGHTVSSNGTWRPLSANVLIIVKS